MGGISSKLKLKKNMKETFVTTLVTQNKLNDAFPVQ
jgi:hypothetical protein